MTKPANSAAMRNGKGKTKPLFTLTQVKTERAAIAARQSCKAPPSRVSAAGANQPVEVRTMLRVLGETAASNAWPHATVQVLADVSRDLSQAREEHRGRGLLHPRWAPPEGAAKGVSVPYTRDSQTARAALPAYERIKPTGRVSGCATCPLHVTSSRNFHV